MTAFTGVWSVVSAQPVSPKALAAARKLVGGMFDTGVTSRRVTLDDGTTINALIVDGVPKVQIVSGGTQTTPTTPAASLWLPRGFVVYPAWSANPLGVGLPIIPAADAGPYDVLNLAPGLDVGRWTAGGPCGEVLVSPDPDAGYPGDLTIPAPLFYDLTTIPTFRWPVSYDQRAPSTTWAPYRLELSAFTNVGNGALPSEQLAIFEGANTLRTTAGSNPANLRLRGYARMAEVTATLMSKNGTIAPSAPGFPPAYAITADRVTKDGYTVDWMLQSFPSFNRADIYTYTASEFAYVGSGASAVASWGADPTLGPELTVNSGVATFLDAGSSNGYSTALLTRRDRWIAAGNMSWQSADTTLPPLSWHGFASLNLDWETYRAIYDEVHSTTAPLVINNTFTTSQGDPWLYYTRSTTPSADTVEPAMGRHIYSRGRSIALAPEGALVWGACVMRQVATTIAGAPATADRLILLAHHPADQPSDQLNQGFTRYLRVWWADIVPHLWMPLDPTMVVVGTDSTDPLAWRGGTLIDLGSMPPPSAGFTAANANNSLKMASQWRFSGDGTRAVCLRDYGSMIDYQYLNTPYNSAGGMFPRAVELSFVAEGTDLGVITTFHDFTAGRRAPFPPSGLPNTPWPAKPMAVDYTTSNTLVYAYAAIYFDNAYGVDGVGYFGTGDATVADGTTLAKKVLYGAQNAYAGQDFDPSVTMCVDVNTASFIAHGTHAYYQGRSSIGGLTPNPNYVCWPFTSAAAHGVRMFTNGQQIAEDWYPVPDGALITQAPPCSNLITAVYLPPTVADCVQPSFVQRFGQTIFSYQVSPTPNATLILTAPPYNPTGPCGCQPSTDNLNVPGSVHVMGYTELRPRGGRAVSSVTLPPADWLIYAKVV